MGGALEKVGDWSPFVLAVINLLIVLATGGYRANLDPVRIAADNLNGPLLLFLILGMATIWLRARERGIPASDCPKEPLYCYFWP